jgi:hypothetical protein
MNVVRFLAVCTGHLYPLGNIGGPPYPRFTAAPKKFGKLKKYQFEVSKHAPSENGL